MNTNFWLAPLCFSLSHSLSLSFSLSCLAAATLDARNTKVPYCFRRGYTKNYVRRNDDKNECSSMSPISSEPHRAAVSRRSTDTWYRHRSQQKLSMIYLWYRKECIAACKYWCPPLISALKIEIFLTCVTTIPCNDNERKMKYNTTNIYMKKYKKRDRENFL